MTLSLDDVRNKRFRMARKSGYEVLEVDEFVDEVEATFAQLIEENQNLKKQVESLRSSASAPAGPAPAPAAPVGPIVVTTGKEASSAVVRLVEMSTEQAERLLAEATEDANRIRDEANRTAHEVTTDARTRAERLESEARVHAERLQADALTRAEALDHEIETRRTEMFGDLEQERDALAATITDLRTFEATYRANLADHLRRQIEEVESGRAEPAEVPQSIRDLPQPAEHDDQAGPPATEDAAEQPAEAEGPASETPRLDALLGEQR